MPRALMMCCSLVQGSLQLQIREKTSANLSINWLFMDVDHNKCKSLTIWWSILTRTCAIFAVCVFSVHCWFFFFFLLFRAFNMINSTPERPVSIKLQFKTSEATSFSFSLLLLFFLLHHMKLFFSRLGPLPGPTAILRWDLPVSMLRGPVHLRWSLFSCRSRCSPAPFPFGFCWQCSLRGQVLKRSQRLQLPWKKRILFHSIPMSSKAHTAVREWQILCLDLPAKSSSKSLLPGAFARHLIK